jgi:hypothetical protein
MDGSHHSVLHPMLSDLAVSILPVEKDRIKFFHKDQKNLKSDLILVSFKKK